MSPLASSNMDEDVADLCDVPVLALLALPLTLEVADDLQIISGDEPDGDLAPGAFGDHSLGMPNLKWPGTDVPDPAHWIMKHGPWCDQ